uniref:ATP synthase F0 subunit 8 n=1 Tax=Sogatella furcifera TaxID=113103 RepID=M9Q2J1_SOGFU|nr:ATP synthase F0 subunit 8 [Sogatella furcifera]AGH29089.1 ATP synthase F0 subunit 8 [Sogatella furcifera]AGH29102.1 ATP synthase F0 subunit 8 [Sogatella furcifera]QVO59334.1 ATP synthase F0 subunit 8 [Sogatella furcifera]UXN45380.1 ATP synthase F0 subunit 8 [Sogatella furcifera]UXN45393.1 ATP synthase F0 subunit 8 [Sogatella furcifera]
MPQMSPCSWMLILTTSNLTLYMIKMSLFFDNKC